MKRIYTLVIFLIAIAGIISAQAIKNTMNDPVRPKVNIMKFVGNLKIDGLNGDAGWATAGDPLKASKDHPAVGNVSNDDASSGLINVMWNDTALIIFADISDETVVDLPSGDESNSWNNDGVEFYFDVKGRNLVKRDSDQWQLRFCPRDDGSGLPWALDYLSPSPEFFTNPSKPSVVTNSAGQFTDHGYSFEAVIPFWGMWDKSSIDDSQVCKDSVAKYIKTGRDISFEIGVNNADVLDNRLSIVNWANTSGKDTAFNSSYLYGHLILSEASSSNIKNISSRFDVYPNPVTSILKINADGLKNITIFNITGQVVLKQVTSGSFASVNVMSLASGIYFVEANIGSNTITQKFIKR